MKNKNALLAVISIFFICMVMSGCRRTSVPVHPDSIREWLSQDPDSCLWYCTDQYTRLLKEKEYQKMERLYSDILRAMPEQPQGGEDMNYLMGWVVGYYYNALMLQDKVDGSEYLTDSLLNCGNLYYTEVLRPELLAKSAMFYLAQNRIAQVDSIGCLFLTLSPTDDPRRDARTWQSMAYALEFCEIDTKIPMQLMEHAVECCRRIEGKVGNEGEIYAYMGYLYWKNGELEKATITIQEAIDWYIARPGTPGDGLIEAYNDLSRVYVSLGLYDKAIEANNYAVEASKELDNWMLEEVYRLRSACFSNAEKKDSALAYIQKAIEATPESAEDNFDLLLRINRLGYYYTAHPDSIAGQMEECHRLLKDTAAIDPVPRNYLYAYYGMALLQTPGRGQEGVEYLERSFRNFHASHFPEGVAFAGNELIRAYIQAGMAERIPRVYSLYAETNDSLQHQASANAAIGANIRYETGRKEQENRVLAAQVSLKQRTLVFTWLVGGLLAIFLFIGGMYLRQRQRYLCQISDARLSRISGLLREQQELSLHNASLAQELDITFQELQKVSNEFNEVSSRLDAVSKQNAVSGIRVKISTELLDSDKEAEFRRNFTAIYPDYLPALHRISADMTPTDELIAMLLLLDLSKNEIALTLGISQNGVNKARSRMRQRLGLKSDIVLEEFLKGMIG